MPRLKQLLIILGIGAVVLWLAGPLREGIGQFVQQTMKASPERRTSKAAFPPPLADVQRALQQAGFDPGPIDGQMGRRTRRALKSFQSANNLKPTGEVNAETWEALLAHRDDRSALESQSPERLASDLPEVAPPEQESEVTEVSETAEAEEALASASQKDEVRSAILESRLRSPERIKKVQLALQQAGFDPGPVDGELGPRTDQALRSFQRANGLEPDGVVGLKTWTALSDVLTSTVGQGRVSALAGRD